jgi:hypothetical protein
MDEAALVALEREFGSKPPPGLTRLDADALNDLVDAVREARRRQAAEVEAAGERALGFIPRLLRGPIRKVVG